MWTDSLDCSGFMIFEETGGRCQAKGIAGTAYNYCHGPFNLKKYLISKNTLSIR